MYNWVVGSPFSIMSPFSGRRNGVFDKPVAGQLLSCRSFCQIEPFLLSLQPLTIGKIFSVSAGFSHSFALSAGRNMHLPLIFEDLVQTFSLIQMNDCLNREMIGCDSAQRRRVDPGLDQGSFRLDHYPIESDNRKKRRKGA